MKPGRDHRWSLGTSIREAVLHDAAISTPQKLRDTIVDPAARRQYTGHLETAKLQPGVFRHKRLLLQKPVPPQVWPKPVCVCVPVCV